MYGNRQQDSEFFAPKQAIEQVQGKKGTWKELQDLNTSFLDTLQEYGHVVSRLVQGLVGGLKRIHQAVRAGYISPVIAQRAAAFAVAAAAMCVAGAVRAALRRRQRRHAWEVVFAHVAPRPLPLPWGS